MAMATSTIIALGLAAAGAGASYYNTERTASRQDNQLADSLRNQGATQRKADAKVNEEVERLKGSTSDDERRKGLDSYMNALRSNKGKSEAGLLPNIGSDAFRADAAAAAQGVQDYGAETAGLMSRIDAPNQQRQGEAFAYGNLGTDLSLLGRESSGQAWLDELRLRAIRRNAGLDAASAFMSGAASSMSGGGGGGTKNYGAG